MSIISEEMVRNHLPQRNPWGHKGSFGKILCICGSVGFTGAPVFASKSALKTGCGLVYLAVPKSAWPVIAAKTDEAMAFPVDEYQGRISISALPSIFEMVEKCDAVLVGCGLGLNEQVCEVVEQLLKIDKPLVLDADGINALQGKEYLLKNRADKVTILTPHEGEFLRISNLENGRIQSAKDFSAKYGVHLVLKGHETVVASPMGDLLINRTGNCGMAKGGSGDILAGMITSFIAQGLEANIACMNAVYMHGLAGDIAVKQKTEYSLLPSDLIDYIPEVFKLLL